MGHQKPHPKQKQKAKANRTEKQRAASRANGALSHGPVTSEGKAASSHNSLRHGLRAKHLTLANEHPEILGGLISDFNDEFQPTSHTEHALVLDMAYAKWRQYRTWISEAAEINKAMLDNRQSVDEAYVHLDEAIRTATAVRASLRETRALDLYNRTEAKCVRQYHRALTMLLEMKKNKSAKGSALRSATNSGTLDADPVLRELESAKGSDLRSATNSGTLDADPVLRVQEKCTNEPENSLANELQPVEQEGNPSC